MAKEKPKAMSLRPDLYAAEILYVCELAESRGVKSKANALAIIINEHKQAARQTNN